MMWMMEGEIDTALKHCIHEEQKMAQKKSSNSTHIFS